VAPAQAGSYTVTVIDATGAILVSDAARRRVLEPIAGLFLPVSMPPEDADGAVDPSRAGCVAPPRACRRRGLDRLPDRRGPWIANTDTSKWIDRYQQRRRPSEYTYRR
jgi:hypothetical protein